MSERLEQAQGHHMTLKFFLFTTIQPVRFYYQGLTVAN